MFVKTVKLKKLAKTVGVAVASAVLVWLAVSLIGRVTESKGISLPDEAAQLEFLSGLGWKTSPEPIDRRSVVIPEQWNAVYEEYAALQTEQGFSLEKYRGRTADIYTYEVYNYGDDRPNIVANLIVCDGRLIAGDVCCTELGGFMQGLAKK